MYNVSIHAAPPSLGSVANVLQGYTAASVALHRSRRSPTGWALHASFPATSFLVVQGLAGRWRGAVQRNATGWALSVPVSGAAGIPLAAIRVMCRIHGVAFEQA